MCAGVTTYNCLRNSGARSGDLVAVLGLGGLGHLGVQVGWIVTTTVIVLGLFVMAERRAAHPMMPLALFSASRVFTIANLYTFALYAALGGSLDANTLLVQIITEEQFRGERFADHPASLRGNTDLLCLTRPAVVCELLDAYLAAGADITSTNTFTATSIAQADYDMQDLVVEINVAAARLAREVADRFTAADPARPRWVAGSTATRSVAERTVRARCSVSPTHTLCTPGWAGSV